MRFYLEAHFLLLGIYCSLPFLSARIPRESPAMNTPTPSTHSNYIGRFAPSPSGPLHMGSLVCALASYLEAKTHDGLWLVRMEDIDPPREQKGAADLILETLQRHQLFWDGDVLFQSTRSPAYEQILVALKKKNISYHCRCTRARLKPLGHIYDGHCRAKSYDTSEPSSLRVNIEQANKLINADRQNRRIVDDIQGEIKSETQSLEDFIVKRKDGLYAYQLAVVVDDIAQNITHVVRGYDLFECTRMQDYFTALLGGDPLSYAHIPIVVNGDQNKLSKQNHAPAVNNDDALGNLHTALSLLQQTPPAVTTFQDCEAILTWAVENWNIAPLRNQQSVELI